MAASLAHKIKTTPKFGIFWLSFLLLLRAQQAHKIKPKTPNQTKKKPANSGFFRFLSFGKFFCCCFACLAQKIKTKTPKCFGEFGCEAAKIKPPNKKNNYLGLYFGSLALLCSEKKKFFFKKNLLCFSFMFWKKKEVDLAKIKKKKNLFFLFWGCSLGAAALPKRGGPP